MKRAAGLFLLLCILSAAGVSPAADSFAIHKLGTMNFRPQKMREHPRQDNWIGGLSLAVSENDWPLLFCLPYFDGNIFAYTADRSMWWDLKWGYVSPVPVETKRLPAQDQGPVRPVLLRHIPTLESKGTVLQKSIVEKDWVHERYRYIYDDGDIFEAVYSRLAPGFMFSATGETLRFFADNWVNFQLSGRPDKERGIADWTRLGKKLLSHVESHKREYLPHDIARNIVPWVAYGGSTIDYLSVCVRPRAFACAVESGVEVRSGNVDFEGEGMKEPWLLVWFGEGSPLFSHTLPGFLAGVGGYGLHQMDCPFLLILEKRPQYIVLYRDGLTLEHEKESIGRVILMPLRGMNFFEISETEKWSKERKLPDEIVEQCRFWTSRMLDYPLTVKETVSVDSAGKVIVKNEFAYEALDDNWNFPRKRIAPISPMVGTAYAFEFPMKFSSEPLNCHYFTRFGNYMAVEGKEQYTYELGDMKKYIWETPEVPELTTEEEKALAAKLDGEVLRMINAGHLAPLLSFRLPYLFGERRHWESPSELLYSLSIIADFLRPETKKTLKAYLAKEAADYPPGTLIMDGKPRVSYPLRQEIRDEFKNILTYTPEMGKKRPEVLYHLWWYAEKLDSWDYIGKNWDLIDRIFRVNFNSMDWATSLFGTLRSQRVTMDLGIHDINCFIAGAIGYARLARHFGKKNESDLAYALASKWLMMRFACSRFDESMYEEDMIRRSSAVRPSDSWWQKNVVEAMGLRQVFSMNQFGIMLDRSTTRYPEPDLRYKNVFPEIGRFLYDYNRENEQRPLGSVLDANPIWYISGGVLEPGPGVCYGRFLAAAYIMRMPSERLVRYLGEPDCIGDLFFFQKAAAVLQRSPQARWRSVFPGN